MCGDRPFAQKAVEIRTFLDIEREPRLRIGFSHGGQRDRGKQQRQQKARD
jgi:hypothetical protein